MAQVFYSIIYWRSAYEPNLLETALSSGTGGRREEMDADSEPKAQTG
jgi:hypothetical protein